MALVHRTVHRHGHFVDVRLSCLAKHRTCRGVIVLDARKRNAPELARVDLRVPAQKTWTIEARLTRKGLAYLKARDRVKALLTLGFRDFQNRSFRIVIVG